MVDQSQIRPFAKRAMTLFEKGWEVIPWRYLDGAKRPTVKAHHGRNHEVADAQQIEQWIMSRGHDNVGIVLPPGLVAFDVDNHEKDGVPVDGLAALAEFENRTGVKLPLTWRIAHGKTADGKPSPYGHLIYRLPAEFVDEFGPGEAPGNLDAVGPGVDLIWPWVRYLAAPGSQHISREWYRWVSPHDPDSYASVVPSVDDVTELPVEVARELIRMRGAKRRAKKKLTPRASMSSVDAEERLEEWRDQARDPEAWSGRVKRAYAKWTAAREKEGSRHDTVRDTCLELVGLARDGHAGAVWAIDTLRKEFVEAVSADRDGETEFGGLLVGGLAIAQDRPSPIGEFTDAALAERVARELSEAGTHLAWNPGLGWLVWDGKRWVTSDVAAITELVRQHLRAWFLSEVRAGIGDEDRYKALKSLQSRAKITAVVDLMDGHVMRPTQSFDTRLALLNVQNGVVDLRTGELLKHDPEYGFTRITAVAYRPELAGRSKAWNLAKEALPPAERSYVMRRLGQAITGYTPDDDKVLFLVGGGANGKTTFLTPVLTCLGDFAGTVRQELLMANNNQHPEVFMDLRGRRLVWMDETAEGQINAQRLKRVVGTTMINARMLYKSSIEFRPTHSLLISTNHAPNVRNTDRGTWRRLLQVIFPFVFGGEEKIYGEAARPADPSLRGRLGGERVLEAVLAELVAEAVAWFDRGKQLPDPPAAVLAATEAWRAESDLVLQFVEENVEADAESYIPLSDLVECFNEWMKAHGHNVVGHDTLIKRLKAHERLPEGIVFDVARRRATSPKASRRPMALSMSTNPVASWVGVRYLLNQ